MKKSSMNPPLTMSDATPKAMAPRVRMVRPRWRATFRSASFHMVASTMMPQGIDDVHPRSFPSGVNGSDRSGGDCNHQSAQHEMKSHTDFPGEPGAHSWRRRHGNADMRYEQSEAESDEDS